MQNETSTVLYITWPYRPAHTAGAIRAVRFTEALVEAGFRVIVLTVGQDTGIETVSDALTVCTVSMDGHVPSERESTSLPRWQWWKPIPGPDTASQSFRAVYQAAHGLVDRYQPDIVFATAPPFPSLLAGYHLAERYKLPLILEFRDAWFTGMPWPYKNIVQRLSARNWERRCVKKADKIITVTDAYRKILIDTYGREIENKTCTIRHGYDSQINDDEKTPPPTNVLSNDKDAFLITHTGQFQGFDMIRQCPLRRIGRGLLRILLGSRSCSRLRMEWQCPYNLMAAVARAAEENAEFRRHYRLVFAGQQFEQIDRWAQQMNLEHVYQLGPVPPEQAQSLIHHSDLLVLLLYGIKGCEYHWCVPSKLYSYLGTGKPVLALAPPGEARDLAVRAGTGIAVAPDDVSAIAEHVLTRFRDWQNDTTHVKPDWEFIKSLELKSQQQRFVDLF